MTETSFQDTPLYAWLRENRWYLLGGAALVCAIVLYREKLPEWRQAQRGSSWNSFVELSNQPDRPLPERLDAARGDDRIFPWLVFQEAQQAILSRDEEAMALLRPELERLAAEPGPLVAGPEGPENLAAHLLGQLEPAHPPLPEEFANPTAEGQRVEISLTSSIGDTYSIIASLYSERTPLACGAFLEGAEADLWDGVEIIRSPAALTIQAEVPEEDAETVALERPSDLHHLEGTLSMMRSMGATTAQMRKEAFQVLLSPSYGADGATTVFGEVTDGLEELQAALQALPPDATLTVTDVRVLE